MRTLTLNPLIPPALWVALALLSALLLVIYAIRRPTGIPRWRWSILLTAMGAAISCVLIVLLNPTWIERIAPQGGRPRLIILCDASSSMATPDLKEHKTRYAAAARLSQELKQKLGHEYDVQVERFAASAVPANPTELQERQPDGAATDLAGAISVQQLANVEADRAVVLLSDGIHNAGGGSAAVLAAARSSRVLSTPIYTHTFGDAAQLRDVQVELRSSQELAFTDQEVPLQALVRHVGMAGRQVSVCLLMDGHEIQRQSVPLLSSDISTVRFTVQAKKRGVYRYQVRVDPISEEATTANNSASFLLRVIDEPIRILVLEGKPYWDGKFLMRTLSSDPSVDVDMRVRLTKERAVRRQLFRMKSSAASQPSSGSGSPAERLEVSQITFQPTDVLEDPKQLDLYQIVIFGRDVESFLTPLAVTNLRTWIARKGGSLVCSRGQPTAADDTRVASLMPVRWAPERESRFHVKLTERGQDLAWLSPAGGDALSLLPSLASASEPRQPKPLAVVLATTQSGDRSVPVITYQPYGTGRVVAIEGNGTWRWAFMPPQYQAREQAFAGMWQSLLRWLVSSVGLPPGQNIALGTDRVSFSTTDIASATLLLREESAAKVPSVELHSEGKLVQTVAPSALGEVPGVYRVLFGKLPVGSYEAQVSGMPQDAPACRTLFDVHSGGQEELDLQARPDLMARIATESGGAVLQEGTASEVGKLFEEHIARSRPERIERTTAWDRWWILGGMFLLWTTAWAVRRSSGLT